MKSAKFLKYILYIVTSLLLSSQCVAQTMSIMPLGDSITQGVRGECGYRRALSQTLLGNAQCDTSFVGSKNGAGNSNSSTVPIAVCAPQNTSHESIPGFRADSFFSTIDARITTYQPDVVLVHAGSNDLYQNQTVASTANDVDEIITRIFNNQPNATVLIANLIPWSEVSPDPVSYPPFPNSNRDMIADTTLLTAELESLVSSRAAAGDAVVLVDVRSGFDTNLMSIDGVHPNPVGEAHISNQMLNALYDLGACNGTQPDAQPPITYISVPIDENEKLAPSPVLSGTALDEGESGFDRVRIAIENSAGHWLNYVSGTFSSSFDSSIVATLVNTTNSSTSWSITTDLSAGEYTLYALGLDNNGNQVYEPSGNGQPASNQKVWTTRSFEVVDIELSGPAPGSTLSSATQTFSWTSNGAVISNWWLYLGTTLGGSQLGNSQNLGGATTTYQSTGLPTDGSTIYARLWFRQSGQWASIDATYSAATSGSPPAITSPANESTLNSTTQTFDWTDNNTTVSAWWLYVGSSVGGTQYFDSKSLAVGVTTISVNGLPSDGSTIFTRLWYKPLGGAWQYQDTNYTANTSTNGPPGATTLITPNSAGSGTQPDYSWQPVATATWYYIWINDSTGNIVKKWYTAATAGCVTGSVCTANPSIPVSGNATWWVRTWNSNGYGPWSSAKTFSP